MKLLDKFRIALKYNVERYCKMFKYYFLLQQLVAKEFKLKYRGSILGILWSVLNPLLNMLVLSIVFGQVFSAVDNYKLYLLSGIIMFSFFAEATASGTCAITYNFGLINKIAFPKIVLPLSKVFLSFINFIMSFIVFLILGSFIGLEFWAGDFALILPIILLLMFTIGFSLILSVVNVYFRDTQHLFSVILTIWMYATPILYPLKLIPEEWQLLFSNNPMYLFIDMFRTISMNNMMPEISSILMCFGWAFGMLIAGIVFFKLNEEKFIFYT